ncbi:MAG: hypothetical protein KDC88_14770 [Ignavibacteriae bacterium]|nr:hypothetical protein [Ignavibacteriota bacterium]
MRIKIQTNIMLFVIATFYVCISTINCKQNTKWNQILNKYESEFQSNKKRDETLYRNYYNLFTELFKKRRITHFKNLQYLNGNLKHITNIYFSPGEIYLQNESLNIVTINNEIYEWKHGSVKGEIYSVNEEDLIAFILYLVDPAGMKISIYKKYLKRPSQFTEKQNIDKYELKLKEPLYDVEGITITKSPFWLNSISFKDQKAVSETTIPIEVQSIPRNTKKIPEKIKFTKSEKTLRWHMNYL